jgi:hypothetical protein
MSNGKSAASLGSACPDLLVRTYTCCHPDGCTSRAGEVDKGVRGARDGCPKKSPSGERRRRKRIAEPWIFVQQRGDYAEAEAFLNRAIVIYKGILGNAPHPTLANAYFSLAEVYRHQRRELA